MTRTNAYTLLCMLIRAFAVWSLVALLIALPSQLVTIRSMPNEAGADAVLPIVVSYMGLLGVVALLWLFAHKLARLALVRPQDQTFESDLAPTVWLGLAISAIGAWQLFNGLVDGGYWVVRLLGMRILTRDYPGMDSAPTADVQAQIVATVLQVILGLVCLLRGKGLAGWVHRMRYGGQADG